MSDVRTPDRKTCMKEARAAEAEARAAEAEARAVKAEARAAEAEARANKAEKEVRDMKTRYHIKKERCKRFRARIHKGCDVLHESDHYPSDGESSDSLSSDEAGAPDPETKKRKLRLAPLAGFTASGYESARVQTSGEGASGGGVPVVEEPKGVPGEAKKEIIMAGPWQPGEWSDWGKASHDLTADGRVVVGDDVKSAFEDLVESERLVGGIRETVASLSDVFADDAHRVMERGLFECFGMERYPPRAPETRLRLHSSAAAEVRKARDALRALAFYAKEAGAATRRAREAMNVEACENWLQLHDDE